MNDTIRLAILGTRGIPSRYGGFETFAEELAVLLVAHGVDVTVYCEAEGRPQPVEHRGIKLVYVPAQVRGPLSTVLFDLRCLWRARKEFDVVYMLGYGAAPFCIIPRLWGTTVWLNVDGIEWARAKWNFIAKLYFKTMEWFSTWIPDRIIADAEGIRSHFMARHRFTIPCSVIPYGAPLINTPPSVALLDEWDIEPGGYYLVVARIEPENHLREIIEGFVHSATTIPLIIVGNHSLGTGYTGELRACADARVRFVGGVYDKERLQALRYFALAYFHGHSVGGTNPSLLEALGCGNLIVAHDNPFNREVCGSLGFYFRDPSDIPKIIDKLENLPEDDVTNLRMAARGRVLEKYDWDKVAHDYMDLLSQVMVKKWSPAFGPRCNEENAPTKESGRNRLT